MKEILSSQLDAVSGGWQDRDGSGKDRLITEAPVLQVAAEITAVTAGFSHSCQKQPLWQWFRCRWFLGNGGSARNGYGGNGTGPREAREFGTKR